MTAVSRTRTFLDALVNAIEAASAFNSQDQERPAAILWPDGNRQWEALFPQLRDRLPIFALGNYAPDEHIGPAYWLRCVIARKIPHPGLPPEKVPILYLPGYSRQAFRELEPRPFALQPLVELQYRGVLWGQKNGRDWTVNAFLQSKDGGLGISVKEDHATKDALQRSLIKLAEEPVEDIQRAAPLRALYLDGLIHPDNVKNVLRWLNDPKGYRDECSGQEWAAFAALCENHYDFNPEKDSPITAAEMLGQQQGNWKTAWRRFAEAPASYRAIPQFLRQAKPEKILPLLDHTESWPQDNEMAEADLRDTLQNLSDLDRDAARCKIVQLEKHHGVRRRWVWATYGLAPLAQALEHLAALAKATERMAWGASLSEIVRNYANSGWRADLAVLEALDSVERQEDIKAVRSAVRVIYLPWLERIAEVFQEAVADSGTDIYEASLPPEAGEGTCQVFVDGLRFDLAQVLRKRLKQEGIEIEVKARLSALPTVTATAKPAITPAAPELAGGEGFGTVVKTTGSRVTAQLLREEIADTGVQILEADALGDYSGRAWCESANIDKFGHVHGSKIAQYAGTELRRVAERIVDLLGHGWQKVVVVTDHGWLLMPGGLPKTDLPEHLTESRKGRCARLKEGALADEQVVPWHWNSTVRIAMARGIYCYESGKEYEHGGLSPQECVVPVLTATGSAPRVTLSISEVRWRGLRCNFTIEGTVAGAQVDIRTKVGDALSSLTERGKTLSADGEVFLFVSDAEHEGELAAIVVVGPDGTILAQKSTFVGGP